MDQMTLSNPRLPQHYVPIADDRDFIDSRKLGLILWTHKWRIIALAAAATLAVMLVLHNITPVYRATASLVIEPKGATLITFQQPTYDSPNAAVDYLQTQITLIQSRAVAERVVRQLNLTEHPEFDLRQRLHLLREARAEIARLYPSAFPGSWLASRSMTPTEVFDATVRELMERTSVGAQGKSQLVNISVSLADRETAALAANALAHGYLDSRLDAQMNESLNASKWMNSRMIELRTQLQESENKLQRYRDAEGLVDVDGVVTLSANELSKTSDRMIDARRQRAEAQSQYAQVKAMLGSKSLANLSSVPAVIGNPVIQQFQANEAQARAKVDELSRRYGDRHPKMIAARSDLAAAQASLRGQVDQVVAGLERNYQLARANEESLRSSVDTSRAQIQDISRKEFKLRELQRDVDSNRTLYDTFVTRLRETTATADIGVSNARIVDPAIVPSEPSAPKKSLIASITALLALVLGCVFFLLRDTLHNGFKSGDDIARKLNLPVLGLVPLLQKKNRSSISRQFERNDDPDFTEAIRTLRTGIMLGDTQKRRGLLVITSTLPGEGKSAIAVNLAFALGQLERVLLVEADLRRPNLARNLGMNPAQPGLASLITGQAKIDACIRRVGQVDILTAGEIPPNPLELLASTHFGRFIEWARQHYDRIILDSPASDAVSDAAVLCAMADAAIYVIKSDSTPAPLVHQCIDQLLQNGAPLTGVVLNQITPLKGRQGYSQHYRYLPRETTQ